MTSRVIIGGRVSYFSIACINAEREVDDAILVYVRFISDITLTHCVKTHAKRVNKLSISNELSKPQLCRSSRMDSNIEKTPERFKSSYREGINHMFLVPCLVNFFAQ